MRRVVVTGMGIVSSIGNSAQEVVASLREAKSGISRADKYAELGFKCQVHGAPKLDWEAMVPRKPRRFMNEGVGWNYIAMDQAIRDSGLAPSDVSNDRTGVIMGSGGPSTVAIVAAADVTRASGGPKKIGPFEVPKAMCSGPSGVMATAFQVKGVNYSISSACATSAHCIGNATETIQWGKQDVMFAGGGTPGGLVVGATDKQGYSAVERVLSPENFVSTVYTKLGIEPGKILHSPNGRPAHLVSDPTPIAELLG